MERALIVKREWLDKIFDSGKTWEMRSTKTNITGLIGLIESGSMLIVGEVRLLGCGNALTKEEACRHIGAHQVEDISLLEKWRYPWYLEGAKRYEEPVPYKHPQGAVKWVRVAT